MIRCTFLEGLGLGVLAGATIGIAIAANRPDTMRDMRRAARRAARKVENIKADLTDALNL